ncbi:MAG: HD-GYP domain-containing protein [Treponema sp.]|jgi:HD-GYP domain-containing protein (c-di-GMP phosphodiesterase class II)|nr:HD-GYP domain-containing protein [Treponema sp.]
MKNYLVETIPPGSYFSRPVYLDEEFVLAAPEMRFSWDLMKAVEKWEFKTVTSGGEPRKNYTVENSGEAAFGERECIKQAEEFYKDFRESVEEFFRQAESAGEVNFNTAVETIKSSLDIIREDRRYLLRIQKNTGPGKEQNYLITHTVWSTIIALIIGMYLKLPIHRLIELGVSALFHEIGMIKLPPEIYLSNRPLSPVDRRTMLTHTLLGYNLLKSSNFPLSVCIGALEHHERENGSGYPRRLTSDKISLYSKIIAVACSYEALSSHRPHREAKDGYTGMLELLKNEGNQYNETVVQALVYSLSIYPIGLYVLLSDGKQGQVVDVNPEKPRFPVVQILGEFTPQGLNRTLETSEDGIRIERPLTWEEMGV